jgi:hypothetical protein
MLQNNKYNNAPLSNREKKHARKLNKNFDNDQIIPWKGGCCYYYTNEGTVTYAISELYNKPRTTSYSGHTIMELEFLSLFKNFDSWKEIYVLCIMATMIPYCHHTGHEIFTTSTYWGIKYDIRKDQATNLKNLVNIISSKKSIDIDVAVNHEMIDKYQQMAAQLFS